MPEDWYSIAAAEKCRLGCLHIDKVPTVSVIGYQSDTARRLLRPCGVYAERDLHEPLTSNLRYDRCRAIAALHLCLRRS